MPPISLLILIGTRPEAIKLAPLISLAKTDPQIQLTVVTSGQHPNLLPLLSFFDITPDISLTATHLQAELEGLFAKVNPDIVMVQGDTTTAYVGALAAFNSNIKIAHVEAGLRSGNLQNPYPEEMHRVDIAKFATYHFSPTKIATENLKKESVPGAIYEVGNTAIDALHLGLEKLKTKKINLPPIPENTRLILLTAHRRENIGDGLHQILKAAHDILENHPDTSIIFPVHPNPAIKDVLNRHPIHHQRLHYFPALDYPDMLYLMKKSIVIITDSGGIQEEAPSLGKPVLVTRDVTERPEGIALGIAKLVGTNPEKIIQEAHRLLTDPTAYHAMVATHNPYGDGRASQRILKSLY